jgi:hypothetical protein
MEILAKYSSAEIKQTVQKYKAKRHEEIIHSSI